MGRKAKAKGQKVIPSLDFLILILSAFPDLPSFESSVNKKNNAAGVACHGIWAPYTREREQILK